MRKEIENECVSSTHLEGGNAIRYLLGEKRWIFCVMFDTDAQKRNKNPSKIKKSERMGISAYRHMIVNNMKKIFCLVL